MTNDNTIRAAANDSEDKPDLGDLPDFRQPDYDHSDTYAHVGYFCGQCAAESGVTVQAAPTGGDHWQNKQISWQEQCDVVFREFDDAVAAHFPDHLPINCQDCPEPPVLPAKPIRPVERSIAQNARNE